MTTNKKMYLNLKLNPKVYLAVISSILGLQGYAQNINPDEAYRKIDSIKLFYLTEAAVRNTILRQIVVSNEITGNSDIKSKLYGDDFFKGKLSQAKTNVLVTLPFTSWGKNSITGSFLFEHQQFHLSNVSTTRPEYQEQLRDLALYSNTVGFNAGYQRLDSLFGRNIIYTANFNALTGKKGEIQKINFLGTAIINIKYDSKTNLSAGLVLNIDPSINIPVFPVFTYWHQFAKGFDLNINLPQQAYIRKEFNTKIAATIGTSILTSNSFFRYDNQTIIPQDINYTTLGLQNGLGLEYRFLSKIMVGLNAGIQTPLSSRAFEVRKSSEDYFIKNKIGAAPYAKLSISLLPVFSSVFK